MSQAVALRLDNGLTVRLLHDAQAQEAAALLQVACGSDDEPACWPGLAHLLEHLLFTGSASYTGAQRLMSWVPAQGGRLNATTRADRTAFFFSLPASGLEAGLARLVDMLAAPLLAVDAVAQEVKVIDAEYRLLRHDAGTLRGVAQRHFFHGPSAMQRFHVGNRASFGEDLPRLRQAVRDFHRQRYDAGAMTLWLSGPQSTDALAAIAQRCGVLLPTSASSPEPLSSLPLAFSASSPEPLSSLPLAFSASSPEPLSSLPLAFSASSPEPLSSLPLASSASSSESFPSLQLASSASSPESSLQETAFSSAQRPASLFQAQPDTLHVTTAAGLPSDTLHVTTAAGLPSDALHATTAAELPLSPAFRLSAHGDAIVSLSGATQLTLTFALNRWQESDAGWCALLQQLLLDEAEGSLLACLRAREVCDGLSVQEIWRGGGAALLSIGFLPAQPHPELTAMLEKALRQWFSRLAVLTAEQLTHYLQLAQRQFADKSGLDRLRDRAFGFAPPESIDITEWRRWLAQLQAAEVSRLWFDEKAQGSPIASAGFEFTSAPFTFAATAVPSSEPVRPATSASAVSSASAAAAPSSEPARPAMNTSAVSLASATAVPSSEPVRPATSASAVSLASAVAAPSSEPARLATNTSAVSLASATAAPSSEPVRPATSASAVSLASAMAAPSSEPARLATCASAAGSTTFADLVPLPLRFWPFPPLPEPSDLPYTPTPLLHLPGNQPAVLILRPALDAPISDTLGYALQVALRALSASLAHQDGTLKIERLQGIWQIQLSGEPALMRSALAATIERLRAFTALEQGARAWQRQQQKEQGEIPVRRLLNQLPCWLLARQPVCDTVDEISWQAALVGGSATLQQQLARLLGKLPGRVQAATAWQRYDALPATAHCLSQAAGDTALLLFCPLTQPDLEAQLAWRLLALIYQPTFFQRLRVEQQVGYVVSSSFHHVADRTGVLFALQSPQLPAAALLGHIQHFLAAMDDEIAQMTLDELAEKRERLWQRLQPDGKALEQARQALAFPDLASPTVWHQLQQLDAARLIAWHRTLCNPAHWWQCATENANAAAV